MLSRPFHQLYVIAQRADWFFSHQRYDWSGVLTFFEGQLYGSKKNCTSVLHLPLTLSKAYYCLTFVWSRWKLRSISTQDRCHWSIHRSTWDEKCPPLTIPSCDRIIPSQVVIFETLIEWERYKRKNCARRPQSGAPYLRKNVTEQDREICSLRDHWFTKMCFSHAQQATLRAQRVNTRCKAGLNWPLAFPKKCYCPFRSLI